MSADEATQIGTFDLKVEWTGTSGARILATFSNGGVHAPNITMWQPELRVDPGRASWRPLPAAFRDGAKYSVSFSRPGTFDHSDFMFAIDGNADGASFEHRVLEDIAATATAYVAAGERSFWSMPAPSPGPGAPPTRSRPCRVVPDDTGVQPIEFPICPATDTDSFTRVDASPEAHQVIVDLGTTRTLDLAVVRGYPGEFFVDVSNDGSTWTELVGSRSGAQSMWNARLAHAAQPRTGRYVRLRLDPRSFSAWFIESLAVW